MIKVKFSRKMIIALIIVVAFILVTIFGAVFYDRIPKRDIKQNINMGTTDNNLKSEKSTITTDKLFNWMNIFKAYADNTNSDSDGNIDNEIVNDAPYLVPVWQPGEINPVIYQKNGKLYRLNDVSPETLARYCRILYELEVKDVKEKYVVEGNDRVGWGLLYKRIGQPFYKASWDSGEDYYPQVSFMERMVASWYNYYYNWFSAITPIKLNRNTLNTTYMYDNQYISKNRREFYMNCDLVLELEPDLNGAKDRFPDYLQLSEIGSHSGSNVKAELINWEYFDMIRAYTYLSVRFLKDFDTKVYNKLASIIKKYKMSLGKDAFVSVKMSSKPLKYGKYYSGQRFTISLKFMYIKPTLDIKPVKTKVPKIGKNQLAYVIQLDPYTISFEKVYNITELYSEQDLRPLLTELGKIYKAIGSGKISAKGYFEFLKKAKLTSGKSNEYFKNASKLGDTYLNLGKSKQPLYVVTTSTSTFRAACLNYKRKYIVDIFYDILSKMDYLDDFKSAWNLGAKYASAVYNTPDQKTLDPVNLFDFETSQDLYPVFVAGKVPIGKVGFTGYNLEDRVGKPIGKDCFYAPEYYTLIEAMNKKIANKSILSKYYNIEYFAIPISVEANSTKDYKNLVPAAMPHLYNVMVISSRYPELDNNGKPFKYRNQVSGRTCYTFPIVFRFFPEFVNKDKTTYPYFAVESIIFEGVKFNNKPTIPLSDGKIAKDWAEIPLRWWWSNLAVKSDIEQGKDLETIGIHFGPSYNYTKNDIEIAKKYAITQDVILKKAKYFGSILGSAFEK